MSKFKIGDFVISKNYSYVLEVVFVEGNTFSGRFIEGSKKNNIENYFFEGNFELIKEDKMENRIVRKLEDLCNMGNGMGLYIDSNLDVRLKDKKMQICCGSDFVNTNLGVYLEVLKSMGFKFEYKPLRTEQEVKREILSLESLHFAQEKPNYYVGYNNLIDKYLVICDSVNGHGLHIYMTEEQAKKYADELNEIIGVGK